MIGAKWGWRYANGPTGEVLAGASSEVELPHRRVLALDSIARRNGATFTTWRGEPATADAHPPWVYCFRMQPASVEHDTRAVEALFAACSRAGLIDAVTGTWVTAEAAVPVVVTELPEKSNSRELLFRQRLRMSWAILRGRAACECAG